MGLVIYAAFSLFALSACMIIYAGATDSPVIGGTGVLFGLFASMALIVCIIVGFDWHASEYKAEIMNREYGTKYTREEVFYASSVIETIRELDRKRLEINGNLLNEK